MRIVSEIPHEDCRITIFSWNGKYLIKYEQGPLEQTYKVSEWDVREEEVGPLAKGSLLDKALERFVAMSQDLRASLTEL